jgi:hypothetical protein
LVGAAERLSNQADVFLAVRRLDSIKEVLRRQGRLPKLPNASAKVVDPKRRQAALKAHETMRRRRAALQGTSG